MTDAYDRVTSRISAGAGEVRDRFLKGKYKGRGFAKKGIKQTVKGQVHFQKGVQQSLTAPPRDGVVIRGAPATGGLWDYDSNSVPYDSFNRNEMNRRMSRPFNFGREGMPYGPQRKRQ